MERLKPAEIMWAGLVGSALLYDVFCPKNQTLSEALDPALETTKGKAILYTAIGLTAAHLCNILPPKLDPLHIASQYLNHIKD